MLPEPTTDTTAEMQALKQFFAAATDKLMGGQVIDMTGIDTRVGQLCLSIQQAPPQDQERFLPELSALIGLLNNYEALLRQLQETIAQAEAQPTESPAKIENDVVSE